jgi:holo-[acyl-carrier protein] synthase|tara:strand:- start:2600 stop:2977 length:378 start_codon:yes stop_codon:yes gene_type:complete
MIYGIGTDIVEIKRLTGMKSLDAFAKKVLTENELKIFDDLTNSKKASYLAKQFAAKEAIAKAFGTGLKDPIQLNNIEILRNDEGKPTFNPLNGLISKITDLGITKTHVSLADEKDYAIAFAILEI